jgi:hypothetical protein
MTCARIASLLCAAALLASSTQSAPIKANAEASKAAGILRHNVDSARPRITHALTAPARVESFYVNPFSGNQGFERGDEYTVILGWLGGDGSRAKYGILGKGADLSSEQVKQTADLLLPRSNYRISSGPDDVKMCEFMPRHGLRFTTSAADTVDALVCFGCAQLSLRTMDGKEHWGGNFDPMEDRLKQLFDQFLPPRERPDKLR